MEKLDITNRIDEISMALPAMQYMFNEVTESASSHGLDKKTFEGIIQVLNLAFDTTINALENLSATLLAEAKTEHPGRGNQGRA